MEGWITIQLTEKGEDILNNEPKILENFIKKIVKSEYFLPVYYNESKSYDNKIFLFTGYLFIRYNKNDLKNYAKLSNNQYFVGPLLYCKNLHLTPDSEIDKLKKELEKLIQPNIKKGDIVKVVDGKYKNLDAIVMEYYDKSSEADLKVTLKCMSIIVPRIPAVCLTKVPIEETNIKIIEEENETKLSLQDKILAIIKDHPEGLTRKEIILKIELDEKELKRVSTILLRLQKKKILKCINNKKRKSIFLFFE
jgi:transcription antitermination factor NusG